MPFHEAPTRSTLPLSFPQPSPLCLPIRHINALHPSPIPPPPTVPSTVPSAPRQVPPIVRTFYRVRSPLHLSAPTPTSFDTVSSVILPSALWNRSTGMQSFLSLLALQTDKSIPISLLLINTSPTSFPICLEEKLSIAVHRQALCSIMSLPTLTLLSRCSCICELLMVPTPLLTTVPTSPGL